MSETVILTSQVQALSKSWSYPSNPRDTQQHTPQTNHGGIHDPPLFPLMQGNGTNVIRVFPYTAIQFAAYEEYKKVSKVAGLTLPAAHPVWSSTSVEHEGQNWRGLFHPQLFSSSPPHPHPHPLHVSFSFLGLPTPTFLSPSLTAAGYPR